ncbi:EPIDERMAL PATTERNING FACTOR-like protein 8 [Mangifera indica]|uniref:EPIDERMAL PATTERNING FACTOR-like protein 8 n=1 Tax=Mangifera indica TaxID=29780 RepID=UPI001CFAA9CA|nr:EPIDERMAL PATTERNING FACTOR-like protein 8 [Mangifera indica]
MASSRAYQFGLQKRVLAMLIIVFIMFSSESAGSTQYLRGSEGEKKKQTNKVVGSRPPACVNKCLNCKPCVATLVVPPHPKPRIKAPSEEDEDYYLLSWKCRCGNKLFHP